jgi:hypothetical protein
MAVGAPAPGGDYVLYVDQPQASRKTARRLSLVAAGLMSVAICAAVLFVATPQQDDVQLLNKMEKVRMIKGLKNELKAAHQPTEMSLALSLIKHAPTASVTTLHNIISKWKDAQVSMDDVVGGEGKHSMLAMMPALTSKLQEESTLCAKKDIIFEKFHELLKKLGHENKERNATDQALWEAKQAALHSWLDGESAYRLEIEKKAEAEKGATFAREAYEKWKAATLDTKKRLDAMEERYPKEKADIEAEKEIIKTIMRYLGIMDDQAVDEKSAAAGGYWNENIDHPNAVTKQPSPAKLKQIKAEIAKLKQRAAAGDGGIKLAMINKLETKLASFAESDYVKDLLTQMLKDLALREEVLESALESTKKEYEEHKEKLRKYEIEVVDLSNAADKATERAAARNLERKNLDGEKINSGEAYDNEHSEYKIIAPPAERCIFILLQIMHKINEHCAAASE